MHWPRTFSGSSALLVQAFMLENCLLLNKQKNLLEHDDNQ